MKEDKRGVGAFNAQRNHLAGRRGHEQEIGAMEHLHSISEQLYTRTDKFKHNLHKFIAQHPLANKHLGDVATMFGLSRAAFICYVVVVI